MAPLHGLPAMPVQPLQDAPHLASLPRREVALPERVLNEADRFLPRPQLGGEDHRAVRPEGGEVVEVPEERLHGHEPLALLRGELDVAVPCQSHHHGLGHRAQPRDLDLGVIVEVVRDKHPSTPRSMDVNTMGTLLNWLTTGPCPNGRPLSLM